MSTRQTLVSVWMMAVVALSMNSTAHSVSAEERTRLAVVVAKTSDIKELSMAELRRMYMGDQVDAGGKKLVPINHSPSSKERAAFDKLVLGMSGESVSRYWIDRKIRGQSGAPKAIDPADLHQRVLTKIDGGVGYVRVGEISNDVKVVRIAGKLPSDSGYPLEL